MEQVYKMYAFLFDKKSLSLVTIGIFLAGLLLFGGGLLVGARLGLGSTGAEPPWAPQQHEVAAVSPPASQPSDLAIPPDNALAIPPSQEPVYLAPPPTAPPPPVERPTPSPTVAPPPPARTEPAPPPPPPPKVSSAPKPAPIDNKTAMTATQPATTHQLYSVQVGAYRYRANAERRVAKLSRYEPYVEVIEDDRGDLLYTVRIGSYDSREQAEATAVTIGQELDGPTADDEEVLVRPILEHPAH